MTCGAIMTESPLSAREDETVGEATKRLIGDRYLNLPVVNADGRFLGMFGIYDLFSLIIPKVALAGGLLPNLRFMGDDAEELRTRFREIAGRKIAEVADRDARVLYPDTPQIEALRLFCQQHTTLAVVERETRRLLGIVSYWDAVCALTGMGKLPNAQ
ncbi:MAG TPA: CBS domain-containing protein [Rhizomicrobium sp.]|nr:CBS domain-containing protein [Rhizomicrobium sp.]